MCTEVEDAEHDPCTRCAASGRAHDAGCANQRIWIPLPGAPGPPGQPFSVAEKAVLDAIARALDGRFVGEIGEQFVATVKAILAQAGQGGTRIEIRDNIILVLQATDIRGASSISRNICTLAQSGYKEIATALKEVAEAVTEHREVTAARRSELLELLDELSSQAALPLSKRQKPGVIKGILTALATGLGAAGGLAEVWSTWGSTIRAFFGV